MEAARLLELGFEWKGYSSSTHPTFEHPEHGRISLPLTPRRGWQDVFRTRLARRMGISKHELESRLGLRQPKRNGPKRARHRNEAGRAARRFNVLTPGTGGGPTARVGSPEERRREIAGEIRTATARSNLAIPGSTAYRKALEEVARLRREYLQLEAAA